MISPELNIDRYFKKLDEIKATQDVGKVTEVKGFLIKGIIPGVNVGSICEIHSNLGKSYFLSEVIGFEGRTALLLPLEHMSGVALGSKIILQRLKSRVGVGEELLGRVIDGMGNPIDDLGRLLTSDDVSLSKESINPLSRDLINEPLSLGVKAIDGLITLGKGQRVGIMAGSGVGKSVLMGMMARNSQADINVIALIGERGREVKDFIEYTLGEEGLKRSVIIVATSDQSPLVRLRGAMYATAVSEYFAMKGKDVLLMMDSITRFAMAQREIGLNVGEPPMSKGYTPSVFSLLPKLLERAGNFKNAGSITGLYTVLVEGDDMDDPIADSVRSIVDGHIVLDRKLAHKGHYPAIDVLQSTSRVMLNVTTKQHRDLAQYIRQNIAVYKDAEDLINIGAYKEGNNESIDKAVSLNKMINNFLKQPIDQPVDFEDAVELMNYMYEGA